MKIIKDKDKTPVGRDVETYCNRCKLLLYHVVISHIDGYVAKVKCLTCGSEHKYHSETLKTKSNSKKTSSKKFELDSPTLKNEVKKSNSVNQTNKEYLELIEKYKDKPILEYDMSKQYNLYDIIFHKNYEKGIIVKVLPNKIEVLFASGSRILACNQTR